MALGLKTGVDIDLMIKAVAIGSGGSTQFGIRAPWMAERKFMPLQGAAAALSHYFDMIEDWADATGTATPLLDRADRALSAVRRAWASATADVAVHDRSVQNHAARKTLKAKETPP